MLRLSALEVALRAARPEDERAVVALLESEALEAAFAAEEFVVADAGDGRIVACARLKPLAGGAAYELASVAVEASLRGTGMGRRVVLAALAMAPADAPVHALALEPGFFERVGFERVDATPDVLREKAEGLCASSGFVPMTRSRSE